MKKFKFDASTALQVHQALEGLKNETLKSMAGEYILGGSGEPTCPGGQSSWSKSQFSKGGGCGCS